MSPVRQLSRYLVLGEVSSRGQALPCRAGHPGAKARRRRPRSGSALATGWPVWHPFGCSREETDRDSEPLPSLWEISEPGRGSGGSAPRVVDVPTSVDSGRTRPPRTPPLNPR